MSRTSKPINDNDAIKIAEFLLEKNITQSKIAELLDRSQSWVSNKKREYDSQNSQSVNSGLQESILLNDENSDSGLQESILLNDENSDSGLQESILLNDKNSKNIN